MDVIKPLAPRHHGTFYRVNLTAPPQDETAAAKGESVQRGPASSTSNRELAAIAAVVLLTAVAFALRLWSADQQLWYDEIVSVLDTIRMNPADLVKTYTWDNQHTFYSLLAHGSVSWLGETPTAVRLPAIIAGALSIPALFWLGRMILPTWYAVGACAILTASYHHVWFSQNARGYTILLLATLLSTGSLLRLLAHPGVGWALGFVLATALGAYTHISMVFVALGQGLVVAGVWAMAWWKRENTRPPLWALMALVASGALTILLHAPMLDEMIDFHTSERNVVAEEWKNPLYAVRATVAGLLEGLGIGPLIAAAVLGGVGVLGVWVRHPRNVTMMVLPCLLTLAVAIVLGHSIRPRFFFHTAGFATLLLVGGIKIWADLLTVWLRPPYRQTVAGVLAGTVVTALVGAAFYQLPRAYLPKQDFVGAIQFIEENRGPGDAVMVAGMAAKPLREYYRLDWTEAITAQEITSARRTHAITWLIHTMPTQLEAAAPDVALAAKDFEQAALFPGTLGEGEMYVLRAGRLKGDAKLEEYRETP